MKIWSKNEDGTHRILGIPVGAPWDISGRATLRCFEPENPALLVPRTIGIGWDLNLGAVAVKLQLIRPDDSLPDLEEYIPESIRKALLTAPWLGALGSCLLAAGVSGADRAVSKWTLTGKPRNYSSGMAVAGVTAAISLASAVFPLVAGVSEARQSHRGESESSPAISIDVVTCAQALGVQTAALLSLLAVHAENRDPGSRQLLAVAAPIAAPVIAGGVIVTTVRSTLATLGKTLASERTSQESSPNEGN